MTTTVSTTSAAEVSSTTPNPSWATAGVAGAAALAASLGLVWDDAYPGDPATAEMLCGYDAVTLLVVVPAMAVAARRASRGSVRARLVVASMMAYLAYTYAYYVFGTGFNDLLLLHALVFTGSVVGLALVLRSLHGVIGALDLPSQRAARAVAAVLALLAISLGVMWVYACVAFAMNGTIPVGSSLVETDTVVHLGIVLDLTVLVPWYGAASVQLWRQRPWGLVLATVALVSGALHQVSYQIALLFQEAGGVPGAVAFDPVEPVILALYAGAGLALLNAVGVPRTGLSRT